MATNDIFRLAVEGIGPNGQDLVNVFHYQQDGNSGDDDGTALIATWRTDVEPAYLAAISVSVAIVQYSVRNLTQLGLGVDIPVSPAEAGDLTGDALPPVATAIVTWTTGFIGRRNRGRTYMWPASEAMQAGGQITGAYAALLATFAAANILINDGVTSTDWQLVVHSIVGGTDRPVTNAQVQEFLGVQRRRRVGVGS